MSVETKKKGLRERPTYNELIEDIQFDEKIKLPNRQAKFIRESPYLSFLDGEGYTDLLEQEEKTTKTGTSGTRHNKTNRRHTNCQCCES